jgi:hypothetical protein
MRKKLVHDQKWLMGIKSPHGEIHIRPISSNLDISNTWKQHKNVEAMEDLHRAYCAVIGQIPDGQRNQRVITILMAAWLREQRRIVPSPTSFWRFFSKLKSNT